MVREVTRSSRSREEISRWREGRIGVVGSSWSCRGKVSSRSCRVEGIEHGSFSIRPRRVVRLYFRLALDGGAYIRPRI